MIFKAQKVIIEIKIIISDYKIIKKDESIVLGRIISYNSKTS
jgi:hypothetical protein